MQRLILYLSGFSGILLITFYTLGLFADKSYKTIILFTGLSLIIFISIPLIIFLRKKQLDKIKKIIQSYKNVKKESIQHSDKDYQKIKGWSMNSSPFRERKSGASWSGGNIHGAVPKRENRKKFFNN